MTTGIYALYWEEQDLIYIGQSQDISSRSRNHFSKMQLNQHSNYKVQNAYSKYGYPQLVTLEICNFTELDELEIFWTKEFNALHSDVGLCIVEPGDVGRGTNHGSSKYSKIQILRVFSLLYKGKNSVSAISRRTKVSIPNILNILGGIRHIWLQETYPDKYMLMLNRQKTRRVLQSTVMVKSPTGVVHSILNIKEFSSTVDMPLTNLHAKVIGFTNLIYGRVKQYKGWRLI